MCLVTSPPSSYASRGSPVSVLQNCDGFGGIMRPLWLYSFYVFTGSMPWFWWHYAHCHGFGGFMRTAMVLVATSAAPSIGAICHDLGGNMRNSWFLVATCAVPGIRNSIGNPFALLIAISNIVLSLFGSSKHPTCAPASARRRQGRDRAVFGGRYLNRSDRVANGPASFHTLRT